MLWPATIAPRKGPFGGIRILTSAGEPRSGRTLCHSVKALPVNKEGVGAPAADEEISCRHWPQGVWSLPKCQPH